MNGENPAVIIIGGGIAGLTAAHTLAQQGIPFLLLEASARQGGVIRSELQDGFLMEAGPDTLLAQKREGLGLCRELGLGERLVPTNLKERTVYVVWRGALVPLPDGMALGIPTRLWPVFTSPLFSFLDVARMGLDLVLPARRDASDESIAAFMSRRLGRKIVAVVGEPLLAGIHSGDPARLSMQANFPRFVEYERRYGSLIRGFLAVRAAHAVQTSTAPFYSLQGGLEEMVTALLARLPAGQVRARQAVSAVRPGAKGFDVTTAAGEQHSSRAVLLAVPPPQAARWMADWAPRISSQLTEIPFVSTAAVYLGYRREQVAHPLDGYGAVVPRRAGLRSAAFSFFSTKFPGRAPEGQVLLRAFLGGARDPQVLDLSDEQMIDTVVREAQPLLGVQGAPLLTRVFRWSQATPQLELGHLDRIAAIEAEIGRIPGLFLTGAGLRSTGIPDGIAEARRAAQAIAVYIQS